jgi:nitroimidazol reductase NimA-like FMN-containing flavoprotein (pyridoxamine 5'-phosphate oxidase superfamily)
MHHYQGVEAMTNRELQQLGQEECRRLLASHRFGRLAFLDRVDVMPMITPVNYGFIDDAVLLLSDEGSKFRAAVENAGAAFEIDGVDEQQRVGWSVVVRGRMEAVTDPQEIARLQNVQLVSWAPGNRPRYLRLKPSRITGRQISIADLPSNWWG